jgi:hypothetical protein
VITTDVPTQIPDDWQTKRIKSRQRFTHPDPKKFGWFIDLTEVLQVERINSAHPTEPKTETKYEVELELNPEIESPDMAPNQLKDLILTVSGSLMNRLDTLLDTSIPSPAETSQMKDLCWKMASPQAVIKNADRMGFPGSMPVSFSRRHMSSVRDEIYFISEKTDGLRFMLLSLKGGASYLVGRKFDFYKLPMCVQHHNINPGRPLHQVLSSAGDTLLDGEIVLHECGKIIYMIFDVVQLNGENFAEYSFSPTRLKKIGMYPLPFGSSYWSHWIEIK